MMVNATKFCPTHMQSAQWHRLMELSSALFEKLCSIRLFLQIKQRDIPGIDIAFLAMDTEEGVEVVWNEVAFSEKKNLKAQQVRIPEGSFS